MEESARPIQRAKDRLEEPPIHEVHICDNEGRTPLLFVLSVVHDWMRSARHGRAAVWRERIRIGLLKVIKALRNDPKKFPDCSSDFETAMPGGVAAGVSLGRFPRRASGGSFRLVQL